MESFDSEAPGARLDALFVVPHLGAGGTQRVVALLLNHWCDLGWRVGLLTLFATPDSYALNAAVLREDFARADPGTLRAGAVRRANRRIEASLARLSSKPAQWKRALGWPLLAGYFFVRQAAVTGLAAASASLLERFVTGTRAVRWLRARFAAHRPRLIVSFLGATNIQTLLAAEGLGLPVLTSERNDPAVQHLGEPWQRLRTRFYARADLVAANTAGAVTTPARRVPADKLRRVRNPLVVAPCPEGAHARAQRIVLVARLVPQKGVDLLVDAFARIADVLPDWHVDLVGDGPLSDALQDRAKRFGVGDRIHFHGHKQDLFPFRYRASVFILPSRVEGMLNALLEALGVGLPVIESDASPGHLELMRNGNIGLVVSTGDVAVLSDPMRRLCEDAPLRARIGAAALRAANRMALPIAAEWDAAMAETIANQRCGLGGDAGS